MDKKKGFSGFYDLMWDIWSSLCGAHVVHIFQGSLKFNSSVLSSDNGIFKIWSLYHQIFLLGRTKVSMETPLVTNTLVN